MKPFILRVLIMISLAMASIDTGPLSADGPIVFVSAFAKGDVGAIHAFRMDEESGKLTLLARNADVEHPFFLALSKDNQFLYSIHAEQFGGDQHEKIAAFKIDSDSGSLRLMNHQSTQGTASCYLDIDGHGKAVLVANYTSGSVSAVSIRSDGSLGEPTSFFHHEGSSVDQKRQQEPHAHCFVISPDNRYAFAADLGLDKIMCYRLESSRAKLSPNHQPFVRTLPGAGPRHLTFHPDGNYVYVINELHNSVSVFDYVSETGFLIEKQTIPTLPESFEGTSHCADLKITPDGKFLYGTNRGHDSIAIYRISIDGRLSLVKIAPSLGKGPQNLAITQDGMFLLCANMPGNNVVVFKISPKNGDLAPVGDPISMPMPSCIMIVNRDKQND